MSTFLHVLYRPPWPALHCRVASIVLALVTVTFFATPRPAYAAAITVDGTTCTLVDAITAANSDTATGGCPAGSGADTITLTADVTLTAVNNNNLGAIGLPQISSVITMEGDGHTISRQTSAPTFRLLFMTSSGTLTLNRLTLQNGSMQGDQGGAIRNEGGVLTVSNSTFIGNSTSGNGGAIYNQGTVTVSNSTFSGNVATNAAGAIFNEKTATVSNSTFSGNSATNLSGGAIFNYLGTLTLARNLLSGNTAPAGAELTNLSGTVNANNYNLFGHSGQTNAGAFSGFTPGATDLTSTSNGTNPKALSAILTATLTDNGGGTKTYALVAGSPALDAGDSGLDTDQRGVTRPQGTADDIGAFELEVVATAPEIDVQGNSVSITSGDTTPSRADDTDFGRAAVGSASVVRTFTIQNTGDSPLALSGSPVVAVSGASAFSVSSQPAGNSVAAGSSMTFALAFNPSGNGVFTATVSIASNDSSKSPYTFVVQGIRTGSDVALGKAATQSSTIYTGDCGNAVAAKAVDGNTSGNWGDCSVAHTDQNNQAWWQVDLGATYPIDVIDLWRRTDCCTDFLRNFDLSISTDGTTWTSFSYPDIADVTTSFVINAPARYIKVQLRDNSYLMLAEVQVWGPLTPNINVQGNSVSITSGDTTPSSADDTDFGRAAVGSASVVRTFTIQNTGDVPLNLSGSPMVAVSGASAFSVSSQPASNSVAAGSSTTFALTFNPSGNGVFTATVSIANNDSSKSPYTFVVQGIRTGSNVALGKAATQSSTISAGPCGGGVAAKAVDGNTSGNWGDCSVAHTEQNDQAWWQVDLGATYPIDVIDLWRRTDCCTDFLRNFDLSISTDGTTWKGFSYPGIADVTTSFVVNAPARYIKVQLRDNNYLMLAEVQVWGPAIPDIDVQGNGVSIANGDTSPATADHTNIGKAEVSSGTAVRTFTIRNVGTAGLTLSGTPLVTVSGPHASDFTVTQPAVSTIAANSSTTFQITFDPSVAGVVTATVSIANTDSDANPYIFVVGGTGAVPNVQFQGVACDLSDAITAANTDTATGACPAGSSTVTDTITLLSDVTLTEADNDGTGTGDTGLPVISSPITIEGASHIISRAAGAPVFRFFNVTNAGTLILNAVTLHNAGPNGGQGGGAIRNNGGTVRVSNSTLSGNTANGEGGAIANFGGLLTLRNSIVNHSHALYDGGAIYNSGTVAIYNSTLSDNQTTYGGGGALGNEGTATVQNSTFSGNSAPGIGGGIFNGDLLTVHNSTFIDNSVNGGGGGISNSHTATVSNSTFSGNSANSGGGIYNNRLLTVYNNTLSGNNAGKGGGIYNASNPSTVTLARSLLSGNTASEGAELYNDPGYAPYGIKPGTVNSNNTNLFGYDGSAGTSGFTPGAADLVPNGALATILGTLADNGGDTQTHALVAGSPALDASGHSGLTTDQRGVTRPQGCADDIGAFELEVAGSCTEIDVVGNGVSIPSGSTTVSSTTVSSTNGTDFGSVDVSSGTIIRTYTIQATGTGGVTLSGSPRVQVSGAHGSDFIVTAQPANNIAAASSTTVQITFDPSAGGVRTATVSIANTDSNENPYTFVLQGEGTLPNAQLNGAPCYLSQAITAANTDTAVGTCPAGSNAVTDTITLLSDVTLTAIDTNGDGGTGLPVISSAIILEGANHTISRAATAPVFRLFAVQEDGTLVLNSVTLRNGAAVEEASGGAIYNEGTVRVNNSTLADNHSESGGAISNRQGTVTVSNSTFSGNSVYNYGAAISTYEGIVMVHNSTFSGNSANSDAGAISNNQGTVTVGNSTFSGNSTNRAGGAIYNYGTATVSNSTFSGNTARDEGGAINSYDGTMTVSNSTFFGNSANRGGALYNRDVLTLNRNLLSGNTATTAASELYNDPGYPEWDIPPGTVNANNANLFGYSGNPGTDGFTPGANDIIPTQPLAQILDMTLKVNGSGPATHALVTGSPALDAAGDSGLDTDERGVTRPHGAADDIGAFELEVVTTAPEVDVQGNNVSIASGDATPSSADYTDFGSMDVSSGTVVRTFTIRNTGTAALTLSGSPRVAVSGANASDFTVTTQPASGSVAAAGSTTFQLTFDPSAAGIRTATVTIANNDSDEGSYTFAVQGTGAQALQPAQLTQQAGYTQTCTTATSPYVKNCTIVFTMQNTSGNVLQVKYYQLTSLSSHVDLLNGTPNPGQVGAVVPGPGNVAVSATFQPTFQLGLKSNTAYTVRFKIYGYPGAVVAAGADEAAAVELGEYEVTVPADAADSGHVFLPFVAQ